MEAVKSTLKPQSASSDFLNDECSDIVYSGRDKFPVSLLKGERTEANLLSVTGSVTELSHVIMFAEQSLGPPLLSIEKAELKAL